MFVNNFVNAQRNRRIAETAHLMDADSISIRIPPIFSTLALSINVSLFFLGQLNYALALNEFGSSALLQLVKCCGILLIRWMGAPLTRTPSLIIPHAIRAACRLPCWKIFEIHVLHELLLFFFAFLFFFYHCLAFQLLCVCVFGGGGGRGLSMPIKILAENAWHCWGKTPRFPCAQLAIDFYCKSVRVLFFSVCFYNLTMNHMFFFWVSLFTAKRIACVYL